MLIKDFHTKTIKENSLVEFIARVKFNRGNSKLGFLTLNDGSFNQNLQVVYKSDILNNYRDIINMKISSVVKVKGVFKHTPNGKQLFEVIASQIEILSFCDDDYPLQKKEHSNEFLREIAHLRPRTNFFNSIFRIRSVAQYACHDFFFKNNFINVHAPIITENDAEGGGESFIVTTREDGDYKKDFFGKKASLTVSGQLNAEAYAQAFKNVYTFSPAFRAENSNTSRHAAEFWMIEPEMAFSDINEIIQIAEKFVKYVAQFVLNNCNDELKTLEIYTKKDAIGLINNNIKNKFNVITYSDAIKLLEKALEKGQKFENSKIFWGMDLQTEHEKYICEKIYNAPVFVINYPKQIKAFYMKQNNDNKTVAGFDLLVPTIGELIGGSERESSKEKIQLSCKEKKINYDALEWYLDLRRFGYYKSAGFGLGFERLIMYLTCVNNIRDVIPFPRTPKNLKF